MNQEFGHARELFPKALREGKLMEYLGGFPGYELIDPYSDSPTDPIAAFSPIRLLIVDDVMLRGQFFDALLALSNDQEYGWMSIYYLHSLCVLEDWKKVKLISPTLVSAIAEALRQNKAHWDMKTNWVGKTNIGGIWGAVKGMNKILAEECNLTVLPEEL